MTTRPGYVWDATASEWVEIGQAAVLAPIKYQTSAPSSPATGDIWIDSDDEVPSVDSTLYYRWTKTMSGGETSLSGTDNNSLALKYTPGYESVFINGVLQVRGSDYVATTGTTVTGLTALTASDVVMVESIIAYSVGNTYTQTVTDAKLANVTSGFRNAIINGGFDINQRAFSSQVISTSAPVYGTDRWKCAVDAGSGTNTYSVQQFTPGAAPVAGYEAKQFTRIVTSGQTLAGTYSIIAQGIENVRTFAGQTATISFWAKAASGTPKIAVEIEQIFGTGGSPSSTVRTYLGQVTLSTSWNRYSVTASIPSISGKTIGTTDNTSSVNVNLWVSGGSTYNSNTNSIGIQSNTFDIWGVQFEAGSVATPFEQRPIGTELVLCKRYYQRYSGGVGCGITGIANTTTSLIMTFSLNTDMRIAPTLTASGQIMISDLYAADPTISPASIPTVQGTNTSGGRFVMSGTSGLTVGRYYAAPGANIGTGYVDFSAEL